MLGLRCSVCVQTPAWLLQQVLGCLVLLGLGLMHLVLLRQGWSCFVWQKSSARLQQEQGRLASLQPGLEQGTCCSCCPWHGCVCGAHLWENCAASPNRPTESRNSDATQGGRCGGDQFALLLWQLKTQTMVAEVAQSGGWWGLGEWSCMHEEVGVRVCWVRWLPLLLWLLLLAMIVASAAIAAGELQKLMQHAPKRWRGGPVQSKKHGSIL